MKSTLGGLMVKEDPKAKTISFFCTEGETCVSPLLIKDLIKVSKERGNLNARACLHSSPTASFHDMILLEYSKNYCRPHKHLNKGETCHIIEGDLLIIVFDNEGRMETSFRLNKEGTLISRIGINKWHVVIPISEWVVYHESKPGPFLPKDDSIFPSWAPDGTDIAQALSYQTSLKEAALKDSAQGEVIFACR